MKKNFFNCFFLILYIVLDLSSFSQVANFSLGHMELKKSTRKTKDLLMKAAVGEFFFHSKVGGISFELIASPDNSVSHQHISLNYFAGKPTDKHFSISFGKSKDSSFFINIPDWQLIPIANYANDTNNAVFTLTFVEEDDNSFNDDYFFDDNRPSPIRYHPAFQNQLLGLRMMQADMLFSRYGSDDLANLPKDALGRLLIGDGEQIFELDTINAGLNYESLKDNLYYSCSDFDSYILTDWGREVRFGVLNDTFFITGEPYYLFTNSTYDNSPWLYGLKDWLFQAEQKFSPILSKDKDFMALSKLLEQGIYSWTYHDAKRLLDTLIEKHPDSFSDLDLYYLFSDIPKTELLLAESQEMEHYNKDIFQFNPVIFSSCVFTMRYAALFRYVKKYNPQGWKKFMGQINAAKGRYAPPNDSTLKKGIITPNTID